MLSTHGRRCVCLAPSPSSLRRFCPALSSCAGRLAASAHLALGPRLEGGPCACVASTGTGQGTSRLARGWGGGGCWPPLALLDSGLPCGCQSPRYSFAPARGSDGPGQGALGIPGHVGQAMKRGCRGLLLTSHVACPRPVGGAVWASPPVRVPPASSPYILAHPGCVCLACPLGSDMGGEAGRTAVGLRRGR